MMLFVSYMTLLVSVNRSIRNAVRLAGAGGVGHGASGSISYSGVGEGVRDGEARVFDHFYSSASS